MFSMLSCLLVCLSLFFRPPSYPYLCLTLSVSASLNHLYISESLVLSPYTANIGDWDEYINSGLSDHSPIIAELDF